MNKKLNLILIAGTLVLLMVLAWLGYQALAPEAQPDNLATQPAGSEETKFIMPDFTVYDASGKAHNLSDFRGKPVVINFWASWCGPCKSEMPEFQQAYETYGEQVHFLMVNMTDGYQETQSSAESFIASAGYTFPVYFDSKQSAAVTYGVTAIPMTYFVDAEGGAVATASGAISASRLQKGIDLLLGK